MWERDDVSMCRANITNGADKLCFHPTKISANGIWQGDNPLVLPLPGLIAQVTVIVAVTRSLILLLRPLGQPRIIAEIIGGILLGPSGFGRWEWFQMKLFTSESIPVLQTMAHIGLFYHVFIVGVEMDLSVIKRSGIKPFIFAVFGMLVPFSIGAYFASGMKPETYYFRESFFLFVGVSVSVTAFPVLARILAELKLLNTEIGRIAMSAAFINDAFAWVIVVIAISFQKNEQDYSNSMPGHLMETSIVVLLCVFVVRPIILWNARRTPEGKNFSDIFLCFILTGVLSFAGLTDITGGHAIFGAFVYGLVIPNDRLRTTLVERLRDFVSGLLLPLYFAIIGIRTNLDCISEGSKWGSLVLVSLLACVAKVGIILLLSLCFRMQFHEGLSLGLLMNTKGLIEMAVLNIGKDRNALDDEDYSVLVLVAIAMTAVITPTVVMIYKPPRSFGAYKKRTIQKLREDSELRLMACLHTSRNVPTIINFLEISNPTKKSPTHLYALHLVELTERASAMVIAHNTHHQKSSGTTGSQSEPIIKAFEKYKQQAAGVSLQPLTAISAYSTMHEDICNIAEEKRVNFIILPFHKQQTVDGGMEPQHPAYRSINQNVLANAPCSVGILIDQGLSLPSGGNISYHLVVLFFGGPDDREALSYAIRMAHQSNVNLTVLRFIPGEEAKEEIMVTQSDSSKDQSALTLVTDNDRERHRDDDCINKYQMKTAHNTSMVYTERIVNNEADTLEAIRSIGSHHDLYVVGRGQGLSPLTAGLTEWSECPELGVIGDLLASSDFGSTVSVLVVQQFAAVGTHDGLSTPDSQGSNGSFYADMYNADSTTPKIDKDTSPFQYRK